MHAVYSHLIGEIAPHSLLVLTFTELVTSATPAGSGGGSDLWSSGGDGVSHGYPGGNGSGVGECGHDDGDGVGYISQVMPFGHDGSGGGSGTR